MEKATVFFRDVSHQLYGVPDYHLSIRAAGIQYLVDHPERFSQQSQGSKMSGKVITLFKFGLHNPLPHLPAVEGPNKPGAFIELSQHS